MKNVYFCIVWVFIFLFGTSISHATEFYQTGWNLTNDTCPISKDYNFTNIYHGEIPDKVFNEWISSFYRDRCYLAIFWFNIQSTTGSLIPVYQPRKWIIGFYSIYSGKHLSGEPFIGFFFSRIAALSRIPHYYGSFWWRISLWTIKYTGDAYFASLNPPFSTAYLIQWYSYLGRPMLVARDNSWLVVDVFIQSPLSNKNQKEIAKKYLWEYWYHP